MMGRMSPHYVLEPPTGDQPFYLHTAISERLGFLTHVIIHFLDETRWKRTLKVVR